MPIDASNQRLYLTRVEGLAGLLLVEAKRLQVLAQEMMAHPTDDIQWRLAKVSIDQMQECLTAAKCNMAQYATNLTLNGPCTERTAPETASR